MGTRTEESCDIDRILVEGTMAKDLLKEPQVIQSLNNPDLSIPRRIGIEEISFAAHVDFQQNSEFIDKVSPSKIILVHGDSVPMGRLKSALLSKYSSRKGTDKEVKVFNPRNCEELTIPFKGLKIAKVLGSLAEEQLQTLKHEIEEKLTEVDNDGNDVKMEEVDDEDSEKKRQVNGTLSTFKPGQVVSGVLVAKDFELDLVQLQDLNEFTQLSTSIVKSKMNLKINANLPLMIWHLEQMFGYINVINDDAQSWECVVMDVVDILIDRSKGPGLYISVEWINDNLMADSLADSIIAILYSIDSSPASVKMSSAQHSHNHQHPHIKQEFENDTSLTPKSDIASRISQLQLLLEAQFGESLENLEDEKARITIGKSVANIDYRTLKVECASKVLKDRIETTIRRGTVLTAPLALPPK